MLGYPPTLGVFKRLTHRIVPAKITRGAGRSRHGHPSATDDINVVEPKVD